MEKIYAINNTKVSDVIRGELIMKIMILAALIAGATVCCCIIQSDKRRGK